MILLTINMFLNIYIIFAGILTNFLGKVCSGNNELAEIDPSLDFLRFGGPSFVSDLSETKKKNEPEHMEYFEAEPIPDFSTDDFAGYDVGASDKNDDDDEDQKDDPDFFSGSNKTR